MFIDGTWDLGVKAQTANAASSGVLGSTNVINLGSALKYFAGNVSAKLFYRFGVTQCSDVKLDLRGDTTAATLATSGGIEVIASTGTLLHDEAGTDLADDATTRYVSGFLHIGNQRVACQYYGLWITTTGTDDVVVAGDCYLVIDGQQNERWARAAVPA